jgi:hypothetical protein
MILIFVYRFVTLQQKTCPFIAALDILSFLTGSFLGLK